MSDILNRLKKASTLEHSEILSNSDIYNEKELVKLPIPALNIAYSGNPHGGMSSGLHMFCGPSKHFKTMYALISAASYLNHYPDSILVFYDNEFGSPASYFESVGIDTSRVIHSPFTTIEELRTDLINMIKEVKRKEKVIFIIDSLGMAASSKEVKDAEDGTDKADFTRAKVNKSLFRIVTPHLKLKDIPLIVIQHTYQEMGLYPKSIVAGGTGQYYAADSIFIIGRQQEKEKTSDKEISGYNFVINVEKSRFVKEKSKINVSVKKVGGIEKYSGLLELALEFGFLNNEGRKYLLSEDDNVIYSSRKELEQDSKFWKKMLQNEFFIQKIKEKYSISSQVLNFSEIYEEEEGISESSPSVSHW